MQRLAQTFAADRDPMTLRRDATGLAPERLIVFELTNGLRDFARAAALVPGLEIIGAEDLDEDEEDASPVLYLMIPDARALKEMVRLWALFRAGDVFPRGFAPWRNLFSQLRDLRAWGPRDRVSPEDAVFLAEASTDVHGMVRIELELVYRDDGTTVEAEARAAVAEVGGHVISGARVDGARYQALLAEVPAAELTRILERGAAGLVAAEAIMHIRPQSAMHLTLIEQGAAVPDGTAAAPTGDPVVAVFDAVPQAGHPRLAGRLSVDDPFNLEPLAVGRRVHGTAMASAVLHGDLAVPSPIDLERRVYFLNVMYAPPTADGSGWGRVLDHLAHEHGLLFVVSAGNHMGDLENAATDVLAFEALDEPGKARSALQSSGAMMAHRRLLSPAESMNALTVGALHSDASAAPPALPASTFDPWRDTGLCTVSSALGPGLGNAVKPDVLAPGGRHVVRLLPAGAGHRLSPVGIGSPLLGGVTVASPSAAAAMMPNQVGRSVGTSVAAATLTGLAARLHEVLEACYADFTQLSSRRRAVLLKALLVHGARWSAARDLIIEVLGPADGRQHVRQKDNVRRYLGYGAVDADAVLACAEDRATLWSVGELGSEQGHAFSVPLPAAMSARAQAHEISITVAWFAPPRVGAAAYRGARLRLVNPETGVELFAVAPDKAQPDDNQAHGGTVIHRRWVGDRAAALGEASAFVFNVQREPDNSGDDVAFAVVATVTMPGVAEVYTQVLNRVAVKPRTRVVVAR
ncbi:S8 family serine peptidase [Brevundimonas naejangsanensis]|uniref:S8 family serine peptidase n=1 Tax=Brevundimonas naejangsanensis TaxID=588932 RepID=UPI0039F66188